MDEELLAYKYLWDGSDPEWVLWQLENSTSGSFAILKKGTKTVLVIENDRIFQQVIAHMLNADVEIIVDYPK